MGTSTNDRLVYSSEHIEQSEQPCRFAPVEILKAGNKGGNGHLCSGSDLLQYIKGGGPHILLRVTERRADGGDGSLVLGGNRSQCSNNRHPNGRATVSRRLD